MKKPAIQSIVQIGCVIAVLAAIAVPLSALMTGQTSADSQTDVVVELAAVAEEPVAEDSGSVSAVSAIMAGNSVGASRRRGLFFGLDPVSAFVP